MLYEWDNLPYNKLTELNYSHHSNETLVFFADVNLLNETLKLEQKRCLSDDEMERYQRFKIPQFANNFFLFHTLKRQILGAILGIEPARVQFSVTKYGKPYLTNSTPDLRINYSHSSHYFALAASQVEVGIDIESHEKVILDCLTIAKRYLMNSDYESLQMIQDTKQRSREFYAVWNRYESTAKLLGINLADVLHHEHSHIADNVRIIPFSFPPETQFGTGALAVNKNDNSMLKFLRIC